MRTQLQLLRGRLLVALMCMCLLTVGADVAAGKGSDDGERKGRQGAAPVHDHNAGAAAAKRGKPIARAADDDDDDDDDDDRGSRGRGHAYGRDDDDDDDDDRGRSSRSAPAPAKAPVATPSPARSQPRSRSNPGRSGTPKRSAGGSNGSTSPTAGNPSSGGRSANRGARANTNGNNNPSSSGNRTRSGSRTGSGNRTRSGNRTSSATGNRASSTTGNRSSGGSRGASSRGSNRPVGSQSAARGTSQSSPSAQSASTPAVAETNERQGSRQQRDKDAKSSPPLPRGADELPEALGRTATEVVRVIPEPLRLVIGVLILLTLFLGAGFAGATVRARRAERLRRMLADDVGLLQSALLPTVPPHVGGALATAAYRPADGLAAGGDFYDVFALDENRTCVIVGDVAGHGRESLPVTTSVRYTVRAYLESGLPPAQALRLAGEVLAGQLREMVTVVAAVYDASTGELTYACAGHPAPEVVGADTNGWRRPFAAPPLGAHVATGGHSTTIPLPPGASACFYTDGLCDVRVEGGRLGFDGLREEAETLGPGVTAPSLLGRVTRLSSDQPDDMAAVVLTAPDGAALAEHVRVDELELAPQDLNGAHVARFLETCEIAGEEVREVLDAAARLADVHGSAILLVRRGESGVEVDVRPPRATRFSRAR